LQVVDAFAIQTEMLVTKWGGEFNDIDYDLKWGFSRSALIIPLLAKFTFHPSIFTIQVFLGPHLTANVGKYNVNYTYDDISGEEKYDDKEMLNSLNYWFYDYGFADKINYPPIGVTGGIGFGVKAGPGNVFVDARFITDGGIITDNVILRYTSGREVTKVENLFYRAKLSFTVGYEFGLGNR